MLWPSLIWLRSAVCCKEALQDQRVLPCGCCVVSKHEGVLNTMMLGKIPGLSRYQRGVSYIIIHRNSLSTTGCSHKESLASLTPSLLTAKDPQSITCLGQPQMSRPPTDKIRPSGSYIIWRRVYDAGDQFSSAYPLPSGCQHHPNT